MQTLFDNRNYNYAEMPEDNRAEYARIIPLVREKSSVIDLGCGNGILLQKLISAKHIQAKGVELSDSGVKICREKGLDVIQGKIDEPLPFAVKTFDYAICNVTIQMVYYPEVLLSEMKRIAYYQIISFPNFAFYKNRIDLLLHGRMPKPLLFKYPWYATGHIHQLSINDFYELIQKVQKLSVQYLDIRENNNKLKMFFIKRFPNWFSALPVFLLKSDS